MNTEYTRITIHSNTVTVDPSTVWADAAVIVIDHFLSPQTKHYEKDVGEFNVISAAFVTSPEQPAGNTTQYWIELVIEVPSHELTQRILAGIHIDEYFSKEIKVLLKRAFMTEVTKLLVLRSSY